MDPQNRIWYKMWQLPVSSVLRKVCQNWQPPKLEISSNLVSFVTQVWLPQVYQLKGLELMKIYYAYEYNSWVSGLWIWSIFLLLMIIFLRSIRVGTERLTAKSYILRERSHMTSDGFGVFLTHKIFFDFLKKILPTLIRCFTT